VPHDVRQWTSVYTVSFERLASTSHNGIRTCDARITRSLHRRFNHCATRATFSPVHIFYHFYCSCTINVSNKVVFFLEDRMHMHVHLYLGQRTLALNFVALKQMLQTSKVIKTCKMEFHWSIADCSSPIKTDRLSARHIGKVFLGSEVDENRWLMASKDGF
jgi:hypothetical protein